MRAVNKTAFIFCVLCCAWAARRAEAAWGVGPLAGANFANADINGHNTHSITGWAFGARLEAGMLPFLEVMVDPMLLQTGAEFDASGNAIPGRGRFVNFEVPILLTGRLDVGGLGGYAFIGPDMVFNTDASGHLISPHDLGSSDVSTTGLAGQVGAGIALGVAPLIDITADARYSHGFTSLLEGAKGDIHYWRSRDVRLTLGLLFRTPRLMP